MNTPANLSAATSLDDILASMLQEVKKDKVQARAAATANKHKPKPRTPPVRLVDSPTWLETALILNSVTTECACCGAAYRHPGRIYLRRWHPRLGTHLQACEDRLGCTLQYHDLPHEVAEVHETTPACPRCFDMTDVIETALGVVGPPRPLEYTLPLSTSPAPTADDLEVLHAQA